MSQLKLRALKNASRSETYLSLHGVVEQVGDRNGAIFEFMQSVNDVILFSSRQIKMHIY